MESVTSAVAVAAGADVGNDTLGFGNGSLEGGIAAGQSKGVACCDVRGAPYGYACYAG
ncbi:hypothetical protein ACO0LB_13660 [Undibacterium sp. SXout7W]|uniref:hypothetical protein n=1 Tax=Undibacterium sp. SXout7W TaxID=3413049 RepID=UPI003BF1AB62